jgi:hypothetical protein
MKRRSFVAGLGAAVAGSGALVSTGAFSSVEADRTVSIALASEDNSFLGVKPSTGANGAFASQATSAANILSLDFNGEIPEAVNSEGGIGVGQSSVYDFDDVFRIENAGTQTTYVSIDQSTTHGGSTTVRFYVNGNPGQTFLDSSDVELPVGNTAPIGVRIDTGDKNNYATSSNGESSSGTANIEADASSVNSVSL